MIVTLETQRVNYKVTVEYKHKGTVTPRTCTTRLWWWYLDRWVEDTQAERIRYCYIRIMGVSLKMVLRCNRGPKGWTLKS